MPSHDDPTAASPASPAVPLGVRLARAESIIAAARAELAAGGSPDLRGIEDELRSIGQAIAATPDETLKAGVLAVAAEIAMLTDAVERTRAALVARLTEAGRGRRAMDAYRRAVPGPRAP